MFGVHGGVQCSRSDDELWRGQLPRLVLLNGDTEVGYEYMGPQIVLGATVLTQADTNLATCTVLDNLVTSIGTDAGVAPAASTLYYAYACTAGAFAGRLALCATPPTMGPFGWALGSTTTGTLCPFLGWIGINSGGGFSDQTNSRLCVSYAWRRVKELLLPAPAYLDNNAATTFTLNTPTWALLAANFAVDYIFNGEDASQFSLSVVTGGAAAAAAAFGIGDNSNTQPSSAVVVPLAAPAGTSVSASLSLYPTGTMSQAMPASIRTATPLGMTGGVNLTLSADLARNGAAMDPMTTSLRGWILG